MFFPTTSSLSSYFAFFSWCHIDLDALQWVAHSDLAKALKEMDCALHNSSGGNSIKEHPAKVEAGFKNERHIRKSGLVGKKHYHQQVSRSKEWKTKDWSLGENLLLEITRQLLWARKSQTIRGSQRAGDAWRLGSHSHICSHRVGQRGWGMTLVPWAPDSERALHERQILHGELFDPKEFNSPKGGGWGLKISDNASRASCCSLRIVVRHCRISANVIW